ncbi:MAG: hypothetical protein P4L10_17670 [Acidobacteriaceae bacterium]|nr:hypothetical protein [Acidobacteriaceae bacterium]
MWRTIPEFQHVLVQSDGCPVGDTNVEREVVGVVGLLHGFFGGLHELGGDAETTVGAQD